MCCFVILLLSNEMQMSVRRFSAIPHLRANLAHTQRITGSGMKVKARGGGGVLCKYLGGGMPLGL